MPTLYPGAGTRPSPSLPTPLARGRGLLTAALLAAGCLAGAPSAHAQLNYPTSGFTNTVQPWASIVGAPGTTAIPVLDATSAPDTDEGQSVATPIGFTFNFQGQSMTHFILNVNGFMKLGTAGMSAPSDFAPYPALQAARDLRQFTSGGIPGGSPFVYSLANDRNILAPFNIDLGASATATSGFYKQTTGTLGNRIMTAEWNDVLDFNYGGGTVFGTFSFQVKLYEGTNIIEFVYGPSTASASTNSTANWKTAVIGLRGINNTPEQEIFAQKYRNMAWDKTVFSPVGPGGLGGGFPTNYRGVTTGNLPVSYSTIAGLDFRRASLSAGTVASGDPAGIPAAQNAANGVNTMPDAGRTFRFVPVTANTNNASVILYTVSKLPIPFGTPHVAKARVTNQTPNTIAAGRNVTLTVTGPGGYSFNSTVSTTNPLAAGASEVVSFAGYDPIQVMGVGGVGSYRVRATLATDNEAADDTSSVKQAVNGVSFAYSSDAPPAGGAGYNAATITGFTQGQFVAKFVTADPAGVNNVKVDFQGAAPASTFKIVIFDDDGVGGAPGTLLFRSANNTTTLTTGPYTQAVTVGAPGTGAPIQVSTGYYVGVEQTSTNNVGFSYEYEYPVRDGVFYSRVLTTTSPNTAWTDFATTGTPARFAIQVDFAVAATMAPNCAALASPAANAVNVPVNGTLAFASGGSNPGEVQVPTGYRVYFGTNQTLVNNEDPSTLVQNSINNSYAYSGLSTLTDYYWKVVAYNGLGDATGCTSRKFTTVPAPPANDNCAAAFTMMLNPNANCPGSSVNGTTLAATFAGGNPSCVPGVVDLADVWYKFTTTNTNGVYLTLALGTASGVGMEIYDACGGAAVANTCFTNAVGTRAFSLSRNTTYWLRLYTNSVTQNPGTFSFCLSRPASAVAAAGTNYPNGTVLDNLVIPNGASVIVTSGSTLAVNTVTVQTGGALQMQGTGFLTSYKATVQDGAYLGSGSANGFDAAGVVGSMRKFTGGTFSFSTKGLYDYISAGAQVTGTGLPPMVSFLGGPDGPLTLTNPVAIRDELAIFDGNINVGGSGHSARMRLMSSASGTANVTINSATPGSVQGVVLVERYIDGSLNPQRGYRHFSSPVQAAKVGDLRTATFMPRVTALYNNHVTRATIAPYLFPNVFRYVESQVDTTFDEGWFSPSDTTEVMTPGVGYAVSIAANSKPTFVGSLTSGTVNMNGLSNTNGIPGISGSGWNLVGNPYPSPIDWDLVTVPSGMSAAISVFKSTGLNSGNYVAYTNGVGPANTDILPMGQAFFTRVLAGQGPVSLQLTNDVRVTDDAAFQRNADTRPIARLTLANTATPNNQDEAYIYFQNGATPAEDARFDASKQYSVGTTPSLFTRAAGSELAINGLPELGANEVAVPLSAVVSITGQYVLNGADLRNFAAGTDIFLADALTGTYQNLNTNPVYTFQATAGDVTPRFTLHFRGASVTGVNSTSLADQLNVYPNPISSEQSLHVALGGLTAGTTGVSAQLFDALGRVVLQSQLPVANGAVSAELNVRNLGHGVYTLRVTTGSRVVTRNVTIQ